MKVSEFFDQFKSPKERKAFIIELVDGDMTLVDHFLNTGNDNCVYLPGDGDAVGFEFTLDDARKIIELRYLIFPFQSFSEVQGCMYRTGIHATFTMKGHHDTGQILQLLEYLAGIGFLDEAEKWKSKPSVKAPKGKGGGSPRRQTLL